MFDSLLKKLHLDKYDLIPLSLYILSGFIILFSSFSSLKIFIYPDASYSFNPFMYTLFILIPTYGYLSIMSSSLLHGDMHKSTYFNFSFITIAFTLFNLLVKYIHRILWVFFGNTQISNLYVSGSLSEKTLFSVLRPLIFILPIILIVNLVVSFFKFATEADTRKGLFAHFDVNFKKQKIMKTGSLTCEVAICKDSGSLSTVVIPEKVRMEGTLIQGSTGTGKTSMLLTPMAASDLEKKYFFKEYAKELGFSCLEKGLAYVASPFSNEEINKNFSLKMLRPLKGKEEAFENELKDIIRYKDPKTGELIFMDLGVIALEPDGEYVKKLQDVGKNLGIDFISVDPDNPNSVGINPFVASDPSKVAAIISNVLKAMYEAENPGDNNVFFAQVTQQAIENLSILLKVMYPKMHNDLLPSLEDMLKCLHNYLLVEEMCEEMKKDEELSKQYKILISYFEKNFYRIPINSLGLPIPGSSVGTGRKSTEQFLYGAITQLDNILRQRDVKRILCSKTNNINFDEALRTGACISVCTRRGRLSSILAKAFGMFFLLSLQDAILRRPGNENSRIPFFFYIDEFPDFVNKETETCFTLFRKYRCGMIVAIQNLSQLERTKSMIFYKHVVLSNTSTQLIFTDTNFEDADYWTNAMGRKLSLDYSYSASRDSLDGVESMGQKYKFSPTIKPFVFQGMYFKTISYKTKTASGTQKVGKGKVDFLNKKFEKPFPVKSFDFEKFKINNEYDSDYSENKTGTSSNVNSVSTSTTTQQKVEPVIDLGDVMRVDLDSSTSLTAQELSALKELMHNNDYGSSEEPTIEISNSIDSDDSK